VELAVPSVAYLDSAQATEMRQGPTNRRVVPFRGRCMSKIDGQRGASRAFQHNLGQGNIAELKLCPKARAIQSDGPPILAYMSDTHPGEGRIGAWPPVGACQKNQENVRQDFGWEVASWCNLIVATLHDLNFVFELLYLLG
jgi:hypothetical protein